MKIENNKIIAATEQELYIYWLHRYDEIFSFPDFLERMKRLGVEILVERSNDSC